jgi:hypothetical protein
VLSDIKIPGDHGLDEVVATFFLTFASREARGKFCDICLSSVTFA